MKAKLLYLILFLLTGYSIAQTYPLVTIQDIQTVPDSLFGTDPPSLLNGDTIRVRGLVLVRPVIDPDTNRRVILSAGARWVTYIQDPENNLWGGLNVLQEDTTLPAQNTFFDLVDTAQIVEFTGKVTEFNTTTEILLITAPQPIPVEIISTELQRPEPIKLKLSDLFTSGGGYNYDAEKYEGMYVVFDSVITSDRETNGEFKINDQNGHSAFIYNQSRYFKSGSAGEIGWEAPLNGSFISYVRGIVTTRTDGYYIVPVYPGDVGDVLASPPIATNISRDPVLVGPNQPVTITANIKDIDGTVELAKIFYRINGGSRDSIEMTQVDSIFTGIIAGIPDSALVDFFIKSTDNDGNVSITPSDTVKSNYFYLVLNRPLTIKDVQYSPFGSGFSAYHGYEVTLTGVVTADTSDLEGDNSSTSAGQQVFIQNNIGPWSGIRINGTEVLNKQRGDSVTVTGTVSESFSITVISGINSSSNITVNSTGNQLPEPTILSTSTFLDNLPDGTVSAEQWEGVLVKFENLNVTDENANGNPGPGGSGNSNFGEIIVDDGSGGMRVELQDGTHGFHNFWDSSLVNIPYRLLNDCYIGSLTGIQWFSFGDYKLIPRKDDDLFGVDCGLDVKNDAELPNLYSLNQNYPNPFNPSTVISYNIPREGFVTLKVYNLLGELVKTLITEHQSPGNYNINFDAGSLSSGIYFYGITAGDFSSVKKMILIK